MAKLKREQWFDLTRDVDWEFTHVDHEAVYPEWISGTGKIPLDDWKQWKEPYVTSYPEYVATQAEKDAGAYSVKAALERSSVFDTLDEGWKSAAKMHFGGIALIEFIAVPAELKMARFGLAPSWRNTAVYGALDEIRHTQLNMWFAHELVEKDPQFDWTQKAYHTNEWGIIAARAVFDGLMMNPNAVDTAIQLPFTFETGFTNLQFVGLASDALASGDINFANMISSIQTDEARHAQQGGPTLEILMEHDPKRAQWVIDKTFWAAARLFSVLTGPAMDYYTPLEHRKQSYKEFMEEWIVDQFVSSIESYGLKKPWYWQEFLDGLELWHHSLALGLWFWRPTVWWMPKAGMRTEEREWLREKYPRFDQEFGFIWDQIAENINNGNMEATLPATLPWLCDLTHLPIGTCGAPNNPKYPIKSYPLTYGGKTYHFDSKVSRQIWWEDRDLLHQNSVIHRLLGGEIAQPDVPGILAWMGLTPEVMGDDAEGYAWAADYLPKGDAARVTAAAAGGG